MNSIELTEEHKSKLLEMCKTLFPEYEEIRFNINAKEYGVFIVMDNGNIIIHWFEFCTIYLSKKIIKSNLFQTHDIDILYNIFLENKIKESKPKVIYELIKLFPGSPKIGYKFDFTNIDTVRFNYRNQNGGLMTGHLSLSDILENKNWKEFFKKLKQ